MTPKRPHPSGRPVRRERKRWRATSFQYPAQTFATPRLRAPAPLPLADAVAYKTVDRQDGADPWAGRIGFVVFP